MRPLVLILGLAGCVSEAATPAPPIDEAVAVRTTPVTEVLASRPIHGVGRLHATTEAWLSFPFGGVVDDVRVTPGQRVRRGEVLAVLDAAPALAQRDAARAALDKAERDAARAARLEGAATAPMQTEDARTGVAVARAQLDGAEFQARRSTLVAPSDGVVVGVRVEDGETVGAGLPVLRFAGADGYEVDVVLAAADGLAAEVGSAAVVDVLGREVPGHVVERAGGAGALGGWSVVVALDADDPGLAPGLVAEVTVAPPPTPWRFVPLAAIAEADGDDGAVFVVDGDVARRVPVTVGFVDGDRVALRDGPPPGVPVVETGVPFVRDGARVRGGAR